MRLSIDNTGTELSLSFIEQAKKSQYADDDSAETQVDNDAKRSITATATLSDTESRSASASDAEHLDPTFVAKDKETKKQLVITAITENAAELSSQYQVFADILQALDNGDELCATIIAGGYTNYSYKIFLRNHPEIAVFAKLAFDFALWNPDPDMVHDLIRTENEYVIMKKVSTLLEDAPIATPFFCKDIVQNDAPSGRASTMKILCTEWSIADEQLSLQFIEGRADRRVLRKVAQTLAEVNYCSDFPDDFNANILSCFDSVYISLREAIDKLDASDDSTDRAAQFLKSVGKETFYQLVDACKENLQTPQVLIHSDAHAFNTLVEAKPDDENSSPFGPSGKTTLCDWEMSYVGPIGRDIGLAWSWPISCLLAHAAMGNSEKVDIADAITFLWDEYEKVLRAKGKDETFLRETYKNCLAYAGWFVFYVHYHLRAQTEFLPIDQRMNEKERQELFNSFGLVGAKLFHIGFSSDDEHMDASLDELQHTFQSILLEEVQFLSKLKLKRSRRQKQVSRLPTSMLRKSGRRISDAMLYAAELSLEALKEIDGDL